MEISPYPTNFEYFNWSYITVQADSVYGSTEAFFVRSYTYEKRIEKHFFISHFTDGYFTHVNHI